MHRLRLAVPAVALALVLPAGAFALSPIPTVPIYVTGTVLGGFSMGCCEYEVTTQHEDWAPVTTQLAWSTDGTTLVAPEGALQAPAGPLTVTVEAWYVSDVVENGQQERLGLAATCDLAVEVPDKGAGMELTLVTTSHACLLEAVPSERGGSADPPDPPSALMRLQPLAERVDPGAVPPPHVHLEPESATGIQPGVTFSMSLGHCGLYSPIDVDGAFWDPIGAVDATLGPVDTDAELGELVNATEVEALLVDHDRLDLRTPLGSVLVLARHDGAGDYPGCY